MISPCGSGRVLRMAVAVVAMAWPGLLLGQQTDTSPQQPLVETQVVTGEAVVVRGDTLFLLYGRVGPFTPIDRARAIERRIHELIRSPSLDAGEVTATAESGAYDIEIGDVLIMTITSEDAAGAGRDIDVLARDYATSIQVVIEREIEAFSLTSIALGAAYTALATAVLFLLLRVLSRIFPAIYRFLGTWLPDRLPSLRVQKLEVISSARLARVLLFAARALRFAATVMLLYLYLLLVLTFFPWTRRLSGEIVGWVVGPLSQVLGGMIAYLPSLFTILVIVAVTY